MMRGVAVIAGFWLWSALVTVPDNQDTFIAALQKIGKVNAIGAAGASLAAMAALALWLHRGRR
jgi:hypothetical protein